MSNFVAAFEVGLGIGMALLAVAAVGLGAFFVVVRLVASRWRD